MKGTEHWTRKGDVKLFLWHKPSAAGAPKGTVFFVHGSSMASQPTFDLEVPGRPHSSVMEWFAERGFDTWGMPAFKHYLKPAEIDAIIAYVRTVPVNTSPNAPKQGEMR